MTAAIAIPGPVPEMIQPIKRTTHHNRINEDDARDLRWYHNDPLVAGVASASGFGGALERAELFALGGRPCRRCGGDPKTHRPGCGFAPKAGGSYRAALWKHRRDEAKRLKLRERGFRVVNASAVDGWKALGINTISWEMVATWLPDKQTRPCQACDLSGWISCRPRRGGPQTARPTGSSVQVGAKEAMTGVDEHALAKYGGLSRMLEKVRGISMLARAGLAAYYGPTGGSINALWWLTPAGQALIDKLDNPHGLTPDALIHNEREALRKNPSTEREIAFGRIAREASELFDHSCQVWNEVRA